MGKRMNVFNFFFKDGNGFDPLLSPSPSSSVMAVSPISLPFGFRRFFVSRGKERDRNCMMNGVSDSSRGGRSKEKGTKWTIATPYRVDGVAGVEQGWSRGGRPPPM